ncbi:MAG: hypothetical protein Phog2KO_49100 [Phototrophicaceae bacterium]
MAKNWKIGIDWRRKGVICWEAQAGDALNILPQPIRYTTLDWRSNIATSVSRQVESTDYGTVLFAVQSGTGASNGFVLGQSDALAVNTIAVVVASPYSLSVRVLGVSNYAGVPLIVRVKDQNGTILATSSAQTLSNTWQTLSVSFNTGASSSHIMLEVIKAGNATDTLFNVAGVMLVHGSEMPSGYNAGHSADLYDNITNQVMDARWYLGFKKPYQELPHSSILNLTLNNSDKRFSPDYISGDNSNPLEGLVRPLRPVSVRSGDGTSHRQHWSGWIEMVQAKTNQYGERTASIKASGSEHFFGNVETNIEIQQNKRTDQIIERLLQEVDMPQDLTMTTLIGSEGYSEIGITAWINDDFKIEREVEIGKSTLAYAADNWVRRSAEGNQADTFNVFRALKDTVAAERGRLFFNREGQAVFWNRHHLITNRTIQATLNDAMQDLAYEFAGEGEFANDITVTCHPRTISPNGNVILWQLDNPITVQPGDTREIGASFHDDSDNRIGGKDIYLSGVSITGDGTLAMKNAGANRAKLVLKNNSSQYSITLNSAEVRGYKITDFGRMDATSVDLESINFYGHREMSLNLLAIDNQDDAQGIADFELMRRRTPSGKVQTISLKSQAKLGGNQHSEQLARTIGDRIKIIESQTGHIGEYFIIGEEQRLSQQATLLETTWYLESATEGDFFMIGEDVIGSGATLLPI